MLKYFSNIYNLYWKHKSFLPKKQYSCFGEDLFVKDFFQNDNEGYYVDVGSYHPFFWNNTYLLYKKNWNGINIDANPLSTELFNISQGNNDTSSQDIPPIKLSLEIEIFLILLDLILSKTHAAL